MKRQRCHDTAIELGIRKMLHARGYRYRIHVQPVPRLRREADIAFGSTKVVMVDGCFWHACPDHATWPKSNAEWWRSKIERNRERDVLTDAAFEEAGWTVVRVWEHEVPEQAVERIAGVTDEHRSVRRSGIAAPVT